MATYRGSPEPSEHSPLLTRPRTASLATRSIEEEQPPKLSIPRAVSICCCFGIMIFMQSANFSVMSTTYSAVAEELEAYDETSWFTSSYLISMSSLSPFYGRLSQIFDPRSCALGAAIIFTTGSIVTAQATTFAMFVSGRAIQGIGGAGIYTLSVNLVIYLADKKRRGLFIGGANACITAGVSLGAVIGGAMIDPLGWRPLFWLQAPITLIAAVGLFLSIPDVSEIHSSQAQSLREKLKSIDYLGSLLLVGTLTSTLIGLAAPKIAIAPILLAVVLLLLFLYQEVYRASSPAIPVAVLSSRGTLLSCATQLAFMTTRWCVLFYSPIYTLVVRSWAPAQAGTILIPTNLGFALGGLGVGWLHIRRSGSFYSATLVCQALFPVTMVLLTQLVTPTSSAALLVGVVFVNGALAGAGLNYGLAHLMHVAAPATHFVAAALLVTARGFAGSFGAGIGGGVFGRTLARELEAGFARQHLEIPHRLLERLLGSPALVRDLPPEQKAVAVDAYAQAIQTLFWSSAALATFAIFTQAGTGWSSWEEREDRASYNWKGWRRRVRNMLVGAGARKRGEDETESEEQDRERSER